MFNHRTVCLALFAAALMAMAFCLPARADDKKDDKKADATGTWKWSVPGRNGGAAVEITLKLKQEGEKLTGTIARGNNESEIQDGTLKDGDVSFKVVRKRNNGDVTTTYEGKLDGDTIKGKSKTGDNGREREFEAKREKAAAA